MTVQTVHVVPTQALLFLTVLLPLLATVTSFGASLTAQRLRPLQMSRATFE